MVVSALIVYGLALAVFVSFYYLPKRQEIAGLAAEKAASEAKIKHLEKLWASLPDLELQLAEQREKVKQVAALIPKETEFAQVLRVINELAVKYSITIEALSHPPYTLQPVANGNAVGEAFEPSIYVGQIEMNAVVGGSYNNLVAFLHALERNFPSLRIGSLQIDGVQGEEVSGMVTAAFDLSLGVIGGTSLVFSDRAWSGSPASTLLEVPNWRNPFRSSTKYNFSGRFPEEPPAVDTDLAEPTNLVERPKVRLTGVAGAAGKLRGILEVGPKSYMVKAGNKIAGVTVLAVTLDGVILEADGTEVFLGVGEEW